MPNYNYMNPKTGRRWTENRKMADMENGCDGVTCVQLPSLPVYGDESIHGRNARKREREFSGILADIKKHNNPNAKHL